MICVECSIKALQLEIDTLIDALTEENQAFTLGAVMAVKWIMSGSMKPSEIMKVPVDKIIK